MILITSPILLIFFTIISLYILTKRAFFRLIKIEGNHLLTVIFGHHIMKKYFFYFN